jgi:hypothetical protein
MPYTWLCIDGQIQYRKFDLIQIVTAMRLRRSSGMQGSIHSINFLTE